MAAPKFKVKFNGRFLDGSEYTIGDFSISKSVSGEIGSVGADTDVSSKITLKGRAYNEIITELVEPENGNIRELPIDFFDVCCGEGLIFSAKITGDNVEFCTGLNADCKMDFQPLERSEKADLARLMKSRSISDTDLIKNKIHRQARYVIEPRPKFMAYLNVTFAIAVKLSFNILGALLFLLSLTGITDLFDRINNVLDNFAIPAKRFHPAVLITDYIQGVLDEQGATFQSSILNNPTNQFVNACLVYAESEEGRLSRDIPGLIPGNEPLVTLGELMDNLSPLFNAKWWIEGKVLRFERHDFNPSGQYVPYLEGFTVCWGPLDTPPPAYARLEYQLDGFESCGNEAKSEWYSTIREWNNPPSKVQSGKKEVRPMFGMSRFFNDGINEAVYDFFGDLILQFFGSSYGELRNSLLFSGDTVSPTAPKIVDMDENGKVINLNAAFYADAIFDEFHEIDNPRLGNTIRWNATVDSGYLPKCSEFDKYANAEGKKIKLEYGEMIIQSVEVDYIARRVKMTGKV